MRLLLQGLEERLGGRLGVLRCWGRCLLVAGAKSYTHMVIALERYYGPLKNAVDEAGLEVSGWVGLTGGRVGRWAVVYDCGCRPTPSAGPWHRRLSHPCCALQQVAALVGVSPIALSACISLQATHPCLTPRLPAACCLLQGEAVLVGVANSVWRASPQRAAMAVDRLMTLRLVSVEAIVGWVFGSQGVRSLGDESLSGAAWEILYNAINKTIARVQVGRATLGGWVGPRMGGSGRRAGWDWAAARAARGACWTSHPA